MFVVVTSMAMNLVTTNPEVEDLLWRVSIGEISHLVAAKTILDSMSALASHRVESHVFWRAGEINCPPDIKAPNGELHTMKCKACGQSGPMSAICQGHQV